jgi:hypothetical protein
MLGYFLVVFFGLVAPLLLALSVVLMGPIKDYTPDRYELSKSPHSSSTQSLATAPPSAPDTTSEAALAAQTKAQSAPEISAKVEPTAQAEPEEQASTAQAEPEEQVEAAAQAEPEEPAKIEAAAEAAPEIPAKVEPGARAPRAQAPFRKKQSHQRRAAQSTDPPWSRDADSFIRYIFFGRVD